MKLNITTMTHKEEKQTEETDKFIKSDAFDKISNEVVQYMLNNKDCMIRETDDDLYTMNIYALYVFSPKDLQKFIRSVMEQTTMNLPVVL